MNVAFTWADKLLTHSQQILPIFMIAKYARASGLYVSAKYGVWPEKEKKKKRQPTLVNIG